MLTLPSQTTIYVARDPVDMRKGINGLSALISSQFRRDPKQPALYVFFNRRREKIKILYWDRNGFALWYKLLCKGRYRPPQLSNPIHKLSASDLTCILEGLDLLDARRHWVV